MELGDAVAKTTEAVGIKPCKSCKKRQRLLNEAGRRGFIKGMAFLGGYALLSSKMAIAQTLAAPDTSPGLLFCRAIGTYNVNRLYELNSARYATAEEHLANLLELKNKHIKHPETTATSVWARTLTPTSMNVMPGWVWDYDLRGADGFMSIVSQIPASPTQSRAVYIVDETWIIYTANAAGTIPRAQDLKHAQDFTGASQYAE
jgi:hypothetical protein